MPYITFKITKKSKQIQEDLFDLILNNKDLEEIQPNTDVNYPEYYTVNAKTITETTFNKKQYNTLYAGLKRLTATNNNWKTLLEEGLDKHYTTFKIPKHSGGFRTIDAPDETLKSLLRTIKDFFQEECKIHPHNTAFAYTPKRCAKNALEKHQYNQSKHYLHLDLKDFFTSCTPEFIHQQLRKIYPFSELYKEQDGPAIMDLIVSLSLYKGHLPQGTPLSPYLTNIIMIPIDDAIYKLCKQRNKQHFVYTRYADDIDISSKYDFDYKELLKEIGLILAQQSPLKINYEKVHYGTSAGRNWHLGLMLNKDNKISIGNKRKREIKSLLLNFCLHKADWTKEDIQHFHGELAYFRSIETEYHDHLIAEYSRKYNNGSDILLELRQAL